MKSLKTLSLGLSLSMITTGCNLQNASSILSSNGVTTSLSMTGSGQAAVAQTNFQKFFSKVVPSAYALTPPLLVDASNSSVSLNEAWIVIREIEFKGQEVAGESEVDGSEVEFEGPFVVDLLSDAPISFGDAVVPVTGTRRVKMQLHEVESLPASAPAGLAGKSIYLNGSINGIAFTYSADDSTEFEIAGPNPIVPSSAKDMLIVIRIADLFKRIDLSAISSPTDIHSGNRINAVNPCPLIDSSATDLYTCFRKGIESESDFGNDDGDKDLDSDDDTVD